MVDLSRKGKPKKIHCEICKESDVAILQHHHIVERTEINTDNSYWNLAVLCPSCHSRYHLGSLNIIGIYPSTDPVMGRTVIYEEEGTNKFGITEPYYTPKPKAIKYGKSDRTEQED